MAKLPSLPKHSGKSESGFQGRPPSDQIGNVVIIMFIFLNSIVNEETSQYVMYLPLFFKILPMLFICV